MLRTLADFLYGTTYITHWVRHKYPGEKVFFVSAATILETRDAQPVGCSPRRYLQRRGVLVLTEQRVVLKSRFLTPTLLLLLLFVLCMMGQAVAEGAYIGLLWGLLLPLALIQRWPYERVMPWAAIKAVKLELISGLIASASMLIFVLDDRAVQVISSRIFTDEIIERVMALAKEPPDQPQWRPLKRLKPRQEGDQ